MIPDIGLMIASYTGVRLVQICMAAEEKMFVKVLAAIGFLFTLVLAFSLLTTGARSPYTP